MSAPRYPIKHVVETAVFKLEEGWKAYLDDSFSERRRREWRDVQSKVQRDLESAGFVIKDGSDAVKVQYDGLACQSTSGLAAALRGWLRKAGA